MNRTTGTPVLISIVAVIYFVLGKLGLSLAFFNGNAAAIYPTTGFALAMVLLFGNRVWLGILVGSLVLDCTTFGLTPNFAAIFLNSAGNTYEPLIGAALLNRFAAGRNAMKQPANIFKFALIAGIFTPLISATFSAASFTGTGAVGWNHLGMLWLMHWLGTGLSNLVIAPLILVWAEKPLLKFRRAQVLETAVALTLLFILGQVVFGDWMSADKRYPLSHLLIPILVWAGFRFGQRGAPAAGFAVTVTAVWGTLQGYGPFVCEHPTESLLLTQAFLGSIVVTGFILLSVGSERKRSAEALQEAHDRLRRHTEELEQRVIDRTQSLTQTIDLLQSFSYSVAHDLRAPLRAMQGLSSALVEDYGNVLDDTGRDYTNRIAAAALKMDHLIQDLLSYGRVSHDKCTCSMVNLDETMQRLLAEFSDEIENRGATVDLQELLPAVYADAVMLEQALRNLLANALKFVHAGRAPFIRIRVDDAESHVRIRVTDNGIGIARQYHERIFRVFERLHRSDVYSGTGIGLAIVQKAVERMGGRVGLESQENKGTVFWIELPKKKSQARVPSAHGAGKSPAIGIRAAPLVLMPQIPASGSQPNHSISVA